MCVLDGCFCLPATDAADAVLRVVAVNDCHIESLHVMQVTCHKHRERRLACASFLGGECHILCLFHFVCLYELLYIILLD